MTHCMYCGMDEPSRNIVFRILSRIKSSPFFIGWECSDCSHIICTSCTEDMKEVGMKPLCVFWSCKSNQNKTIKTVVEFSKPTIENIEDLMAATYESNLASAMMGDNDIHSFDRSEGTGESYNNKSDILASKAIQNVSDKIKTTGKAVRDLEEKNIFVEINDGDKWINVLCKSFEVQVDNNPYSVQTHDGEKRFAYGQQNVIGLFEIILPTDSVNWGEMKYIRAYTKDNGHKTTFKGVIASANSTLDVENQQEGGFHCTIEAHKIEIQVQEEIEEHMKTVDWGDSYSHRNTGT